MASPISGQGNGIESHLVSEDRLKKSSEAQAGGAVRKVEKKNDSAVPEGDVVEISEIGEKQANHKSESVNLPDGSYSTVPGKPDGSEALTIVSTRMTSGRTVVIDKIWKPNEKPFQAGGEFYGYQANVFGVNGKLESSFTLKQDTIINEDKDGRLNVKGYTKGDETDGNDLIIGLENKDLAGGHGDDTIVELSGEYNAKVEKENTTTKDGGGAVRSGKSKGVQIDGGSGNDQIVVHGGRHSKVSRIETGTGDDAITVDRAKEVTIDAGEGSDSITAGLLYKSVVKTGSGNDILRTDNTLDKKDMNESLKGVSGVYESEVDLGAGDDQIQVGALRGSNLNTGTGSDVVKGWTIDSSSNVRGEGNIKINTKFISESNINSKGSMHITTENIYDSSISIEGQRGSDSGSDISSGDTKKAKQPSNDLKINAEDINDSRVSSGGQGDLKINAEDINDSRVSSGGQGDLKINAGDIKGASISSGGGSDSVSAVTVRDSKIETGAGSDSVFAKDGIYKSKVYTGAGHDTVKSWELDKSVLDTGAGDDKAKFNFTISDSIASFGNGNDELTSYVSGSFVDFGQGNDILNAYAITSSIVSGLGAGSTLNLTKGFNDNLGSWNGIVGENAPDAKDVGNSILKKVYENYKKWKETGAYNVTDG